MSEAKRLNQLINLLKTNAFQFSKSARIAQGSISAITSGKKRISRDILDKITAQYPSVSIDWLLKGTGEPFLSEPVPIRESVQMLSESQAEYSPTKPLEFPTDDQAKENIAHNLRAASEKWGFTQHEMLQLFGLEIGRQGLSTYYTGKVMPKLTVLLKFEQATGWPLLELTTRKLKSDELPEKPVFNTPIHRSRLFLMNLDELHRELQKTAVRIAKLLSKMDNSSAYN